jgi:hypothetical protein
MIFSIESIRGRQNTHERLAALRVNAIAVRPLFSDKPTCSKVY